MNKIISRTVASVTLLTMIGYTLPVFAYTKDETVYSKLDTNGDVYKTMVSTHIKNDENEKIIKDMSDLLNIKNTGGDEKFTQDAKNITWEAYKNDIYYQGDTKKDLPIECNVKYELDGKEMSAEEIAGKSGKIRITLEYVNKEEKTVVVNGKTTKMYVPFVVVAGTIFDNKVNKKVTVSNGKVIDNGSRTIVAGIAMPGLQKSLNIDNNEIKIPNNIEIELETTNFETNSIVSYVTPKVLEENDLAFFEKLDNIYDKVDTLENSSQKLEKGAKDLKKGTSKAYKGADKISLEVEKSTNKLKNDNTEALDNKTLSSIKKQAESAAKLSKTQKSQIKDQAQKAATLTDAQKTQIATQAKATVDATFTDTYKAGIGKQALANVKAQVGETAYAQLEATGATQLISATAIQTAYNTAISVAQSTAVSTAQTIATTTAGETAVQVAQSTATTTATETAVTVAKQVGNEAKKTFTKQVVDQMGTLGDGLNQLTEGLSELDDGANKLANGMKTFNKDGIKKITDYINGNVKDVTERAKKLKELSKEYNNFTMLNKNNEGEVKFIMIIDGIKSKANNEQQKEKAVINSQNNNFSNEKEDENK